MSMLVIELGPLGVFLLMVPESACIPLPSEVTLMCAGFAVRSGWMSLWVAVLAATAGNLVGSLIAYGIGRRSSARNRGRRADRALARCDRLFSRYGTGAVFFARLTPLARSFISLPAGHARIPWAPFILMTTVGCAIWAAAFTVLGLAVGSSWSNLSSAIGSILAALCAVAATAWLVRQRLERSRRPQ